MHSTSKFTRTDLIVVIVVGLLATTLVAQVIDRETELYNRQHCAANLRGIVQAMLVYGGDNQNYFPSLPPTTATTYDPTLKPSDGMKSPEAVFKAYYQDKKYADNPFAAPWILVLQGTVSPKSFLCRSDPFALIPASVTTPPPDGNGEPLYFANFQDKTNFSYSMTYPRTLDKQGRIVASLSWRATSDASCPVMSDMAPYLGPKAKADEPATRPANSDPAVAVDEVWAVKKAASQNHQFEGQNVVFGDCHVVFAKLPTVGTHDESIWGFRKNPNDDADRTEIPIDAGTLPHPITGTPGDQDTLMIPMRDAKGELR